MMTSRDWLQLMLLSAIWGASFLLIQISGHSFPPAWVALLRLAFGAGFLWTVLLTRGGSLPPRQHIATLLLVALFNNAIPFAFFAWGEQTVPSSIAAILNATTPIWTLILGVAIGAAASSRYTIYGVLLGFCGVLLVVLGHGAGSNSGGFSRGIVLIALASLSYAVATVIAKAKLKGFDPIGLATTQLSLAGLMVLPVALFGPHPASVPVSSALAVIVLGVAGSGLAYLLYYRLLARVSSTHVASVTYLLPIWGLFWGSIAHERIRWTAYVGVLIVIAGLALLNRSGAAKPVRQKVCADPAMG
ncbi:MAG TPA: DMT family transporter [Acidobacteriaceae bacterium]|nr:DMT family transporter [Acidobacteriaceae bacterium]